jgi:hypothetical protein
VERLLILALLMCAQISYGQSQSQPQAPRGWIEGIKVDSVVLNWNKVKTEQDLSKSPSLQVQKLPKSDSLVRFVKQKKIDKDSCRDLVDGGWNQTWCIKNKSIFVILSKNEDKETLDIKKTLRKWVLTHE